MKVMKTEKGTELPLLNLRGKDYLQVAHRIVWFRERHPEGRIETSLLKCEENYTIARAVISIDCGPIASATKREDKTHFADHLEKAETGAIGRALALCGFGTQFAPELDEGERLADSPLPSKKSNGAWTFPFGKHQDKTIAEVGVKESYDYAMYLHKNQKDGEKPSAELQSIFDNVKKAYGEANKK